jgi:CBS domain-containing protein
MQLQEIMRTRVVTIESDASASAALSRMRKNHIRHLVVTSDGELAGIISERDLGGPDSKDARTASSVGDLMNGRVVSAQPTTTLRKAANLMSGNTIGSLPVLEHGELVGIVTATDVFDALGSGATRPTRRARLRTPESAGRASFAAAVPKAMKLESAAEPSQIPAHIRAAEGDLSAIDRESIRRKLGRRLGKFAGSIERVSVRTKDVNGPRGGADRVCRIKVVLSGLPSVVVEHRSSSLVAAVDGALAAVERTVRRALRRRRMKPLRRAA